MIDEEALKDDLVPVYRKYMIGFAVLVFADFADDGFRIRQLSMAPQGVWASRAGLDVLHDVVDRALDQAAARRIWDAMQAGHTAQEEKEGPQEGR